jgi:hypothetical protein
MGIPIQSIEESLSVAHVGAIVSKAGASFNIVQQDYGVDVEVRKVQSFGGKLMDLGTIFDCQLKSTTNWEVKEGSIVYDVEIDTYNKLILRSKHSSIPCMLIVLCLPKEQDQWLISTNDELILKKCCYYYHLTGNTSSNNASKRIKIPITNRLTPESVLCIIEKIQKGEIQ